MAESQALVRYPPGTLVVVGAFTVSGVAHFAAPEQFEPLVPPLPGGARAWVLASGAAELICAGGLLLRSKWAPVATAGTLAAVWVGNWHMALHWQRSRRPAWAKALAWGRLPLQVPLLVWAVRSPTRNGSHE